ncbi:hemin-degrading factor [Hoeflea sp. WL0058]|uniref:Hemin-degrading factor n=1 Tax=Flavimaribacter sediminis TaxID=2865987 RepID=A0AAE2ZQV8_9HYPH|nr:ChuX/HutX family heme-like substrate-binding protein [Flavimaribacter sediminis]MBW8639295.1 hemin-degrading factor [Flavimaribacter sediminis]
MTSSAVSSLVAPGKPTPSQIRKAREDNPKMRERELATTLGISEAEYVAAWCGISATRIEPRVTDLLTGLEALGEVMALTRNDSAVHEKIGIYDGVEVRERGVIVVGDMIDLRIRQQGWVHGFAVEKQNDEKVSRSLQIFDASGDAVHKIHLRPGSNAEAYTKLVEKLTSEDQSPSIETAPRPAAVPPSTLSDADAVRFREGWAALSNVHQFSGLLRAFGLNRHDALLHATGDFAWRLDKYALAAMMKLAASKQVPVMCFVASSGVTQIHSGVISEIKEMGPWINVLDATFHLHLRLDHVNEVWAVRKPTGDGHVTSIEAYDAHKNPIIQFFGLRRRGETERDDWRFLIENLPQL